MSYKIGDEISGGIVFAISKDGEHGLIAAKEDLAGKFTWSEANSKCYELVLDGHKAWLLRSRGELNLIYWNLKKVDLGGFAADWYWSSMELDYFHAWCQYFGDGFQDCSGKDFDSKHVRAVRAF